MRSFTIGRILDIPIRVNLTLLLFLPLLVFLIQGAVEVYVPFVDAVSPVPVDEAVLISGSTPWVIGIVAATGLFVGVLLHELGHSVAAMRYDIPIASITLWIFGGLARMEELPEDWDVEFWIALAGPITSLLVAAVCYVALFAVAGFVSPVVVFLIAWLAIINLTLAIFNMLPAFPMDGGRVLRALLARSRPYAEATSTAATIGRYFGIGMVVVGVLNFHFLLALVGIFVYVAAGAESRSVALREVLADVQASDLVREEPRTVTSSETVQDLVDRILRERRTTYPVVDDAGQLVGLVSLSALKAVGADQRSSTTIGDVMTASPQTVTPETPAFEVLQQLANSEVHRVVVLRDGGEIVGTVGNDDVVSYIDLLQGIEPVDRPSDVLPRDGYA